MEIGVDRSERIDQMSVTIARYVYITRRNRIAPILAVDGPALIVTNVDSHNVVDACTISIGITWERNGLACGCGTGFWSNRIAAVGRPGSAITPLRTAQAGVGTLAVANVAPTAGSA